MYCWVKYKMIIAKGIAKGAYVIVEGCDIPIPKYDNNYVFEILYAFKIKNNDSNKSGK